MTESRLRHKVDDIVGRPKEFFPKLPQNKVVVAISVRERTTQKTSRDAIAGEIATEMVSLIWTVYIRSILY